MNENAIRADNFLSRYAAMNAMSRLACFSIQTVAKLILHTKAMKLLSYVTLKKVTLNKGLLRIELTFLCC